MIHLDRDSPEKYSTLPLYHLSMLLNMNAAPAGNVLTWANLLPLLVIRFS